MIRIGNGYDVHAFGEGDFITLGGEKIPYLKGIEAHSDGDVLIHALCDALLGALALGDIGHHFPDNDSKFENINSQILLQHVIKIIRKKGYRLNNCDCTVVAQSPKLAPYIADMRKNLSEDLGVKIDAVSVKATTTEKLGFVGKSEGIAVYAVVLLESVENDLSA
jgi:2-C-methyl-D-erythritol 2,4-cyclodiphosphate synthase